MGMIHKTLRRPRHLLITPTFVYRPSQWRIPMGVGFIFPFIMAGGIMFLDESPRWDYRKSRIDRARTTIAHSYSVPINHWEVNREMREIKEKFDAENAGGGKHPFYEVFTGPRMAYRLTLGVTLQALQQLTGANFFFYYGRYLLWHKLIVYGMHADIDAKAPPSSKRLESTTHTSLP